MWYDINYNYRQKQFEVLVDYYDKENNYYIIYFPHSIKNYIMNKSFTKLNKIGYGLKKNDNVIVIGKKIHFEKGVGLIVYTKYKKTARSTKLQIFINNILRYLFNYYRVYPNTKTKYSFKKWE